MKHATTILKPDEVERMLTACKPTWTGVRNRALVALMYRCGLRVGEACGLDLENIQHGEPWSVRVERPKGWKRGAPPRELDLDSKVREYLEAWVVQRPAGPGPLFLSGSGQRLQTSYLRQLLPRLARDAGIWRRVHPHALRHTFARELYDEGVGIVHIKGALGHSSLETTETYLKSIGASEVRQITGGREWNEA